MSWLRAAGTLAAMLALMVGALGAGGTSAASPLRALTASGSHDVAHCPNYQNSPNCVVVPPSGIVNVTICGVHFVGTAAPGTTIECSNLPLLLKLPCKSSVSLPQTGGAAQLNKEAVPSLSSPSQAISSARETCCETGVSLSIHGTSLRLRVPGGKIYAFNPATGRSVRVSAIAGSGGEYTILYGSCGTASLFTGEGSRR